MNKNYTNRKHTYSVTTNVGILNVNGEKVEIKKDLRKIMKKEEHPSSVEYWNEKGEGKDFKISKVSKYGHVIRYEEFDPNLNGTIFYTKEYE